MSVAPSLEHAAAGLPPVRTDLASAKRDLDEFGLTRFFDASAQPLLAEALARLNEQAAGEAAHGIAHFEGAEGSTRANHFGPNQRIRNLINKGEAFRRMMLNPAFSELMAHMLGDDFLVSSLGANIVRRGGVPGGLHADAGYSPAETPYAVAANCIFMLSEFTEANGATRVVPGSHLWKAWPTEDAAPEGMVQAVGPAGTMLVFDGRLWHGTGPNLAGEARHGVLAYCCRPWLRQQENMTLSVAPEVLAGMPDALQARLGFRVWKTLGRVFDPGVHNFPVERPTEWVTELKA